MPVKELCGPSKAQDLQIEVSTRAEGWALAGERGGIEVRGEGRGGSGGGGAMCGSSAPVFGLKSRFFGSGVPSRRHSFLGSLLGRPTRFWTVLGCYVCLYWEPWVKQNPGLQSILR